MRSSALAFLLFGWVELMRLASSEGRHHPPLTGLQRPSLHGLGSGIAHDQQREAVLGHVPGRDHATDHGGVRGLDADEVALGKATLQIWSVGDQFVDVPQDVPVLLPEKLGHVAAVGEDLAVLDVDARRSRVVDGGSSFGMAWSFFSRSSAAFACSACALSRASSRRRSSASMALNAWMYRTFHSMAFFPVNPITSRANPSRVME